MGFGGWKEASVSSGYSYLGEEKRVGYHYVRCKESGQRSKFLLR